MTDNTLELFIKSPSQVHGDCVEDKQNSQVAGLEIWMVNVYAGSENSQCPPFAELLRIINEHDRARCLRLRGSDVQYRFAVAHAALRIVLARRVGVPVERVELYRDVLEKPHMKDAPLAFNMAHSGDVVLIALASTGALGIDVEQLRPIKEIDALVEMSCTPREKQALRAIRDPEARAARFLQFWTRKEAALKANGQGLRLPLRAVETADGPWVIPDPTHDSARAFHVTSWRDGGYVAALATAHDTGAVTANEFMWN